MPPVQTPNAPLTFFLLIFVLSLPFWLLGALVKQQFLPGVPISALAVLSPLLAALLLVYRAQQAAGVTELLKRPFDYERIKGKVWYVPIILLMPLVMSAEYNLLRLWGSPIPGPHFDMLTVLLLTFAGFVLAAPEELGWMGYAIEPLQNRFGALQAGLLLGAFWAVWHYVPLLQVNRSWVWIAWWSLTTVAHRVIMVWLYNHSGRSVFGATVYHATINVTWQLFPVNGSFYDPQLTALLVTGVAIILTVADRRRLG